MCLQIYVVLTVHVKYSPLRVFPEGIIFKKRIITNLKDMFGINSYTFNNILHTFFEKHLKKMHSYLAIKYENVEVFVLYLKKKNGNTSDERRVDDAK